MQSRDTAVADWWQDQLERLKGEMIQSGQAGGPGWNDIQAKLTLIRQYKAELGLVVAASGGRTALVAETLGVVVRRLAFALHCDRPDLGGWVDSWRPDGG